MLARLRGLPGILVAEQEANSMEFRKTKTKAGGTKFNHYMYFVCSRHGTGGVKKYDKKHLKWTRKISIKRTGCTSTLTCQDIPQH